MPQIAIGPAILAAGAIGGASSVIASSAKKRAQQSAEDFAKSQEEVSRAEQKRLEEKYGLTPGELERQDRMFELEKQQQATLEQRAKTPGEELMRQEGPVTNKLLDEVQDRLGRPGQELFEQEGDVNKQLVRQISSPDDEMFKNELELARQMVNAEANRRGVFGGLPEGGIRFENLGRAAIDLAIKSASERLNQQKTLADTFVNLATSARAEAGAVGERALTTGQTAKDRLSAFLSDLQNLDAASKGRALQAAGLASQVGEAGTARAADIYGTNLAYDVGREGGLASQGLAALGDIAGTITTKALDKYYDEDTGSNLDKYLRYKEDPLSGLGYLTGSAGKSGNLADKLGYYKGA